jgi:2-polyprenyl-3-methyl-5-hydroxy-6-metoxy-1,4-benzoquinol methylase
MRGRKPSHSEKGLLRILARPWVYELFTRIVAKKKRNRMRLVEECIKPFAGCRILDIGCGPADMISYLPDSVGEYVGFDMNPAYIASARKRWKHMSNCRFFCQRVEDAVISEAGCYDIVLALGIVHHLNDNEALGLFNTAYQALSPGGTLITYDSVYVANQHWLAKWLISKDRGKAVRTVEGYETLARHCFSDIEGQVIHDRLRIPYTVFVMRCHKKSAN